MTTTDRTNAKKAVKSYLIAIKQREFVRAYELTQLSWRDKISSKEQAIKGLRAMYVYEFNNIQIRKTSKIGNCTLDVEFGFDYAGNNYVGIARIICERAPYKPCLEGGIWGVNPTSVLRIKEVESGGKTETRTPEKKTSRKNTGNVRRAETIRIDK